MEEDILLSIAFGIVTGVGQCVVDELENSLGGTPRRVCLAVPGDIAWDECDCGQFAQTIVSETPTENFPIAATDRRTTACGPQFVAVEVLASMVRCVPGVGRDNRPPTCDQLLESARILESDRTALRRGVTCCLWDLRQAYRITDFTVGAATTVGPEGLCVGVQLSYRFAINSVCCG